MPIDTTTVQTETEVPTPLPGVGLPILDLKGKGGSPDKARIRPHFRIFSIRERSRIRRPPPMRAKNCSI
jgi:hypothetical protein